MQIKTYRYNTNSLFQLGVPTKKQWYFCCIVICSYFFGISHSFAARPGFHYPYEKCSRENASFTDRIVQESQDFSFHNTQAKTVCFNCIQKKQGAAFLPKDNRENSEGELIMRTVSKANDISPLCFLSSMLRASKGAIWNPGEKSYYHCNSSRARNPMRLVKLSSCSSGRCIAKPQRPCLNEDYVRMTAKAFNETADCFGFSSRKSKEALFALMNHESSFVLNKRASTSRNNPNTARCYGQIKHPIIIDINKYIHYGAGESNWVQYHQIYKDVSSRCPNMTKKIIGFNGCQTRGKTSSQFVRCMAKDKSAKAAECQTSQDPYSCLFYTLYNVKRNEVAYYNQLIEEVNRQRNALQKLQNQIKHSTISLAKKKQKLKELKQMEKDFEWPIAFNEILLLRGHISSKAGGEKVYREFLFKNTKEMYELFSHINYRLEDVNIKKTPVFDANQLKWMFLHLAHNGGTSVINNHFPEFMKYVKKHRINSKNRHHKAFFTKGGIIRTHRLVREFQSYTVRNKHKIHNANEVALFIQKISTDLKKLSNPKVVKDRLGSLTMKNKLDAIQVAAFAKEVKETCPKKVF